jgi:hypothetical protein
MNKRNKYGKPSSSFRSYTDINNYNNFLLELDKTNKENPHPPSPVTSFSSQKESVKSFIKSVDTSNPVIVGALGQFYEEYGLLTKPKNKIEEFMEREFSKKDSMGKCRGNEFIYN